MNRHTKYIFLHSFLLLKFQVTLEIEKPILRSIEFPLCTRNSAMSRASGLNSSFGTCGYPGSLKDESNWRPRTHTCLPSMRLHLIQTNPPTNAHPRGLEHARQSMQQLFSLLPRTFVGVYV